MLPDVLTLLPHRPPMVLVDSLVSVDVDACVTRTTCRMSQDSPLAVDGRVPRMLVLEMLAQSAACLKGYIELMKGLPVRPAYLVRVDDLNIAERPRAGQRVDVEAWQQRSLGDYFVYESRATLDGRPVASGTMRFVVEGGV
jgi:predicted hotdog family 3-hydroxylacyl-ACP dehydratase